MTNEHDKDLGQDAQDSGTPRWRLARWILAGALVTPLVAGGVAWLARKPIARAAMQSWCNGQSLVCDAQFDRVGPGRIVLSELQVSSGTRVLVEVGAIDAGLTWRGLLSPAVSTVAIDAPVLWARQDGSRISLDGLERLVPKGGGGGAMPQIDLTNGRLILSTPAGDLSAAVTASGIFPEAGQLDISIVPAALRGPQGVIDLKAGTARLTASEGRLTGNVLLEVNSATSGDISLSAATLRADLPPATGGPAETRIEWAAALQSAAIDGAELTGVNATGSAEFGRLGGGAIDDFLRALTQARVEAVLEGLKSSAYGSGPAQLQAELTAAGGQITGPVRIDSAAFSAPGLTAGGLSFEGEVRREATSLFAIDGTVSMSGASLSQDIRSRLLAPLTLPGALASHGESARKAFDRGLRDFNTNVRVKAGFARGAVSFSALGDTKLSAASGLKLAIQPQADVPWLTVSPGGQAFGGALSVSGGGGPTVRARIEPSELSGGRMTFVTRDLVLSPWTVNGLTIASGLSELDMEQSSGALKVAGKGTFAIAGTIAGAQLRETAFAGAVEVINDASGLQARSTIGPCLGVKTAGVMVGAIAVSPVNFDLCTKDGFFIRPGSRNAAGSVVLGNIKVPFTMTSGGGTLGLESAAIDWSVAQGLRLLVRADTMDLPMQIGERTLSIAGTAPRFDLLTRTGPSHVAATLGATVFGGTLIPAKVSAQAFRFNGTNASSGLSGDVSSTGVLIQDFRDDPLYRPLRTDLTATIADNQLSMSGPLRARVGPLRKEDRVVADSMVNIDIIKLDGTATVRSRDITFSPAGFQPEDISPRLVGVFTQATGALEASADFAIRSGQIAGTSEVSVTDFGFQTTRLGRVTDVDGRVRFSDVMTLTTLPGQEVTIGSVSPGVTLSGGRIVFGLESGTTLNIETGTFPFAGGILSIEPLGWQLGGGNQRIEVAARGVQLAELVEILKLPDTKATGTIGGRFPIDFEGANVFIRDARLTAEAPGGRLSYTGGVVDAVSEEESTARLAFEALKDFEFSVLEIGVSGNTTGRMDASMRLSGVNLRPVPLDRRLTIPPGQAFEFDIGFNVPFQQMLRGSQQAFDQRVLLETIVRMREEERDDAKQEGEPE